MEGNTACIRKVFMEKSMGSPMGKSFLGKNDRNKRLKQWFIL